MEFEKLSTKYVGSAATSYVGRRMDAKWMAENSAAQELLMRIPRGSRVLDAPVGTGRLAPAFKARDLNAHGLDVSPDMLAQARSYAQNVGLKIELRQGDIRHIPYPDDYFDLVTCLRFLNWLDEPGVRQVVKELTRVSRDKLLLGVRYLAPFGELGVGRSGLIRRGMRLMGLSRYSASRSSLTNHDESFLEALFGELRLEIFDVKHVERRWDGTDYAFFLVRKHRGN